MIGDAIRHVEQEFFLGRERELTRFRTWLAAEEPVRELLFVVGRGGIGKSSLLREFARQALATARTVVLLDCRTFTCTPAGFVRELGYPDLPAAVTGVNQTLPLLMLDSFEEAGPLDRFLAEEFLPQLDRRVRVVIAGRLPPIPFATGTLGTAAKMRMMTLSPFSAAESREFLRGKGLTDQALLEQVVGATAGNPLAVSLAAEMAIHLDIRDFTAATEWHLVVRVLADRVLRDVKDQRLRELLYAGAVVRQFDEPILTALTDQGEIDGAFLELCRLTAVHPSAHGLMLYRDIRKILVQDLRWRSPDRYEQIRQRAFGYYLHRLPSALPSDREWLLTELFFLGADSVIQSRAFDEEEESSDLWIEPGRPGDQGEVHRLCRSGWPYLPAPVAEAVLQYPGTQLRVARDQAGRVLGVWTAVPICEESLHLFEHRGVLTPLVSTFLDRYGREGLAPSSAESRTFFLLHPMPGEWMAERVEAALIRNLLGFFAGGGVYLLAAPTARWKEFADKIGFEFVQDGYILDLTRSGVESWVEAIMLGRPIPRMPNPADLEQELKAVLTHWHDDAFLSRSPLAHSPLLPGTNLGVGAPERVRAAIRLALEQALMGAPAAVCDKLRALELAYLHRSGTHEQNAELLHVSRATYYRMLDRAIRELAAWLNRTAL